MTRVSRSAAEPQHAAVACRLCGVARKIFERQASDKYNRDRKTAQFGQGTRNGDVKSPATKTRPGDIVAIGLCEVELTGAQPLRDSG